MSFLLARKKPREITMSAYNPSTSRDDGVNQLTVRSGSQSDTIRLEINQSFLYSDSESEEGQSKDTVDSRSENFQQHGIKTARVVEFVSTKGVVKSIMISRSESRISGREMEVVFVLK